MVSNGLFLMDRSLVENVRPHPAAALRSVHRCVNSKPEFECNDRSGER